MNLRTILTAAALAAVALLTATTSASATQPGPGDKQCVPGLQGTPHPAHKAGVRTNAR
ncbi:hypothetical protein ACFQLX_11710 [Streptomyces polyrhachis]|uniref:Uncharacterized protein n=1 Tax=Streptomyces polyrhachis TaxID=1282885 RepID=A0ABW2GFY8_9ACTN